jgi:hypothetical protein
MDRDEIWFQELARDHLSGAAEIVAHVAERLRMDIAAWMSNPERLARFGQRCIAAQPSMAPLINLFNDLLWAVERSPNDVTAADHILFSYVAAGGHAPLPVDLCPAGRVILTLSYSSSVLGTLLATRDRIERVLCLESRPLFEGRTLAERLAQGGVPATVVIDAAMAEMVERADLVVVGADCIHPGGLINKQGTLALALLAASLGKMIVPIGSRTKTLSRDAAQRFIKVAEQNPAEVWDSSPQGISVENRYFDTTPLSLFKIFFLDGNMINRQDLQELLGAHRLHPLLALSAPE